MAESSFDPRSLDAESIIDEARERAGLRDFVPTLPPGAGFTFAAEPAGPRASDGG